MSNVLSEQENQQVIALGRLGWSLRRIQQETGVRRETASTYLKAAGIPVQPRGRRGERLRAKPAISISPVTTDSGAIGRAQPTILRGSDPNLSTSVGEPFREAIELGAMASTWACCKRVSSTAPIPPLWKWECPSPVTW